MLNVLINLLKENSFYIEEELKDLSDTCCPNSTIKIIAFDKVKDKLCSLLNIPSHKKFASVDLVYFGKKDKLYFIEMKSFNPYGRLTLNDFIVDRINGLSKKAIESMFVLLIIMGYFSISQSFYNYFLGTSNLKITSFLLSNVSDTDLVKYSLANQNKFNITISEKKTNCMESEIRIINCNGLKNLVNIV